MPNSAIDCIKAGHDVRHTEYILAYRTVEAVSTRDTTGEDVVVINGLVDEVVYDEAKDEALFCMDCEEEFPIPDHIQWV